MLPTPTFNIDRAYRLMIGKQMITILHLEDDLVFAHIVSRVLTRLPSIEVKIVQTDTLARAVSMLENETFDLVISDLSLPDSDPVNTIDRVTQTVKRAAVIFLSSETDPEIIERHRQLKTVFLDKTCLNLSIFQKTVVALVSDVAV